MTDVFNNKSSWLHFAQEHNATSSVNATQLSGSQSYTLAAIHLAANIPVPKSVLLDTKRAQGSFVSDHFDGLRKLHESNIKSGGWLPSILDKCREFAAENSIDSDALINKVLDLVDNKVRKSNQSIIKVSDSVDNKRLKPKQFLLFPLKPFVTEIYDDDDIKI